MWVGWADEVVERGKVANNERTKELSASTKDNIVKLPRIAVAPTGEGKMLSSVCVPLQTRQSCWRQGQEVYMKNSESVAPRSSGSTRSVVNQHVSDATYFWRHTQTDSVRSVPDAKKRKGKIAVLIVLLYILSPGSSLTTALYDHRLQTHSLQTVSWT